MIRNLLVTAAALILAACSNAAPTVDLADLEQSTLRGEPVMFSVTDDDSEIILFGTFHILPKNIEWESQTLADAIARSDEAWFELPAGAQDDPALQQLTMQFGMSQEPLSDKLDAVTLAQLETEAGKLGLPMEALNQMQPWLASVTLPVMQMMNAGFDLAAGAEAMLEPRLEYLPRKSFETAEQQLRFFADMDQMTQIDMLKLTLDGMEEGTELMTRMAQSWATGNVDMLEEEVVAETKRTAPDMYATIFTQRNAAWTERLDQEMKGSGVDFVAVGTGHLLGPDSVPVMMAAKGYDVRVLTTKE
jgi:uncharacterized protein YbaP (TraB family)